MACRQSGQSLRAGAQWVQQMRWPHGRNTTPISLSMQILHVRSSFSRRFSFSRSEGNEACRFHRSSMRSSLTKVFGRETGQGVVHAERFLGLRRRRGRRLVVGAHRLAGAVPNGGRGGGRDDDCLLLKEHSFEHSFLSMFVRTLLRLRSWHSLPPLPSSLSWLLPTPRRRRPAPRRPWGPKPPPPLPGPVLSRPG